MAFIIDPTKNSIENYVDAVKKVGKENDGINIQFQDAYISALKVAMKEDTLDLDALNVDDELFKQFKDKLTTTLDDLVVRVAGLNEAAAKDPLRIEPQWEVLFGFSKDTFKSTLGDRRENLAYDHVSQFLRSPMARAQQTRIGRAITLLDDKDGQKVLDYLAKYDQNRAAISAIDTAKFYRKEQYAEVLQQWVYEDVITTKWLANKEYAKPIAKSTVIIPEARKLAPPHK